MVSEPVTNLRFDCQLNHVGGVFLLTAENDNFVAEKPARGLSILNALQKIEWTSAKSARRPIQNPMFIFHSICWYLEEGAAHPR